MSRRRGERIAEAGLPAGGRWVCGRRGLGTMGSPMQVRFRMSDVVEPLGAGRIEPRELEQEMRSSYLDYAMSVIVGRALPDVRDGLKPVHRRILWAMHDAGHQPNRPYVKCARVTGDVMGKYHPHDSSSIYDAIARLVQPFSLRYPLVDGQGNFGSIDDDPPAAERYTECRLAKLATEMLRDIDSDTVDFGPNYDESRREPQVLPSRFPNLLVNGSTGIAVGMATNIPPHNLAETIDAVVTLIDKPTASVEDLMKLVKGPDFPTGGIVVGRSGIRDAYRTGRGRIVMRARAHVEELRGGKNAIIVTELPVRREEGRRRRRDLEDRRSRSREGDHRGLRPPGLLRQDRHAHPDRAEARGGAAGRPQQALQAHGAPDHVRLQRGRPRRRRAADAVAPRVRPLLPRLPARGRHPALAVRAAQGARPGARARGLPHRPRQPRRGHPADPRVRRRGRGADGAHGALRAQRAPGAGDPRPAAARSHRASSASASRTSTPISRSASPSSACFSATSRTSRR